MGFIRWVVEWSLETGSLIWWWEGVHGSQPILMPGFTYYWWIDDSATLYPNREGRGGRSSDALLN